MTGMTGMTGGPTPDRWLVVYDKQNGLVRVRAEDAAVIEAAVERYIGQGAAGFTDRDERDSILVLTTVHGERYHCLASMIGSWMLSTPAARRRDAEFEAALAAEHEQLHPTPAPSVVASEAPSV